MSSTAHPSTGKAAISALLPTLDHIDRLNAVLRHLSAQSLHEHIELVFAAPSAEKLSIDLALFSEFAAVRVVECQQATTREELYTAAVYAATAPLIVLMEDHCFPEPDWAENLLQVHRDFEPCAVVGPVLVNANPDSVSSWVHLIIGFGDWISPVATGQINRVAAHNSCYHRNVLTAYSFDDLLPLLRFEVRLHDRLRRKGERLLVSGNCCVHHINISKWTSLLISAVNTSRNFGSLRVPDWSLGKRLLYIIGSPLIPLILFSRMAPNVARVTPYNLRLATYCLLFITTCMMGLGELLGYTVGAGHSLKRMTDYEMKRTQLISDRDKALIKARYGF